MNVDVMVSASVSFVVSHPILTEYTEIPQGELNQSRIRQRLWECGSRAGTGVAGTESVLECTEFIQTGGESLEN